MINNFQACLAFTLAAEGGFVNNPDDPGGATNMGITIGTLSAWLGRPCTAQDVQMLSETEAGLIYQAKYWGVVRGDDLPAGIDLMVFDWGVNVGPGIAARVLQEQLGVTADGAIGPATLGAMTGKSISRLINAMASAQISYYQALPQFAEFGSGWTKRTTARQAVALKMAAS